MRVEFAKLELPRFVTDDSDSIVLATLALYNTPLFEKDQYCGPPIQSMNTRLINDFIVDRRTAFVAFGEGNVPCAVACYEGNYRLKRTVLLERLIVAENTQGCGVGRFMIDNLAEVTRQQGFESLKVRSLKSVIGFVPDEIVPENPDLPYMSLDVRSRVSVPFLAI